MAFQLTTSIELDVRVDYATDADGEIRIEAVVPAPLALPNIRFLDLPLIERQRIMRLIELQLEQQELEARAEALYD